MQQQSMPKVDIFLAATECAAHGIDVPAAWRNLLDQDTLDALDEIRKANEHAYDINTVVLGQSTPYVETRAILCTEEIR